MLVMVVFFIAFRWIHLSTPLIRLFLLVLIFLLMVAMIVVIIPSRTVLLLTSFPVRRAIMFMLVSWFGLTLPLLNAADWFRRMRLLKRLVVSSHLSEVLYFWSYCWRY